MTEKREPHPSEPTPESSSNASGPGSRLGQPPSDDPYAHLKPHERHLISELLRFSQFLDDIPDGPDGMPLWTPEERELLAAAERLEGRPLDRAGERALGRAGADDRRFVTTEAVTLMVTGRLGRPKCRFQGVVYADHCPRA
jgi:hypothetical protein